LKFSKDFLMGFSESGFQFEMGYPGHEDPNSDWWHWVHSQDNIASGIVSGHLPEEGPAYLALYKQDHDLSERLGADILRIGIEWSRLFPKPTRDIPVEIDRDEDEVITSIDLKENALKTLIERANKNAVETYRGVFKDWVNRGKKLIINLNHFTLPVWIHDPLELRRKGVYNAPSGWLNEETIIEFVKYVYAVEYFFDEFADYWSTLNEPNAVSIMGYLLVKSGFPPGIPSLEYTMLALRNQIIAHARAYDVLKYLTRKPVGVILNYMWFEPHRVDNEDDVSASNEISYMYNLLFTETVTSGSSIIVSSSSLKNKLDWIGVNYYTRMVITRDKSNGITWRPVPGYGYLCTPGGLSKAERQCSEFGWEFYPEGLENILLLLHSKYGLPLIVTENGIADANDAFRPRYLVQHLEAVWRAIQKGADVKGYLHWALTDNYEWAMGYNMRFGLIKVDFESKKRYIRPSALVFREIARNKEVPEELLFY
jgi:Beta-glucosidase/6-phospho-beta-glucosidase/beta-galactosidase